jgi:hypothetical protein
MTVATALAEPLPPAPADELDQAVEESILRFLNGETDGEDLFNALYGDVLDEPIPLEMLELVRVGAVD